MIQEKVPGEEIWAERMLPLVTELLKEETGCDFSIKDGGIVGLEKSFAILFSWRQTFQMWSETFLKSRNELVKIGRCTSFAPCYEMALK